MSSNIRLPSRIKIKDALYIRADMIPGGRADKKTPSDFDPVQLEKGIKVEMEHTKNKELAREIAMDHLTEFPDYYIALEKMERELEEQN